MKSTTIIFQFLTILPLLSCYDVEEDMTMGQIIEHWGYPMEKLEVVTKDGYILDIFRMRHGRNGHNVSSDCRRPSILLVHGLGGNGVQYILNPPDQSAAFVFADGGMDVFLMNHRGTTYSKRHLTMKITDNQFWKFTMDEFAKYDVPAVIDKIIELTGNPSVYYLGHSQGTLVGMMTLSENPSYNKKVKGMFMLAPAASAKSSRGTVRFAFMLYDWLAPIHKFYANFIGSEETSMPMNNLYRKVIDTLCSPAYFYELCKNIEFLGNGAPNKAFNASRIGVYFSHIPGGTSSWNILHWGQLSNRGIVQHFDMNPIDNLRKYGQITAPPYNYKLIDAPIHLFSSENDWLAMEEDIVKFYFNATKPGVIKGSYRVNEFNHLDWTIAMNAPEKVYKPILQIINKEDPLIC